MKKFFVRAYRPYIVDFVWVLNVPAKTQEEAIQKVAAIQKDENSLYPEEWVVSKRFEESADVEMAHLHGHNRWEVTDQVGNEETAIQKDTSKQRAFVFSFNRNAPWRSKDIEIEPVDHASIPRLSHDCFGVLIAEPSEATIDEVEKGFDPNSLVGGEVGQLFINDNCAYSVIWAFANPQ